MIKKTITYEDFDGEERTEDFYFHLTRAEAIEMFHSEQGGLDKYIDRIVASRNNHEIVQLFKELVLKSYGEKSPDGRRFIKNNQLREEFEQTNAYVELFMSLAEDEQAAADFINAVVPKPREPKKSKEEE